jgi:hypothetical protein
MIRMLQLGAGPSGNWSPGMEIEIPEEQAKAFIKGHYAVPVETEREVLVPDLPIETASPVVKFGKHKGKTVEEIRALDPKYVTDFLSKNDDDELAKAAKGLT